MPRRLIILAPLLLLVGCGSDAPPPPPAAPPTGQVEGDIRKVGAASAVGYDGAALQADVQRTVDAQQERNAQTEAATRAAGE